MKNTNGNHLFSPAEMVELNEKKKYKYGTIVLCGDLKGEVMHSDDHPYTNYIMWEDGVRGTYDDWWLDENVTVIEWGE